MKRVLQCVVCAVCLLTITIVIAQTKKEPTPAKPQGKDSSDTECVLWPIYDYGGGNDLYYCDRCINGDCSNQEADYYFAQDLPYPCDCSSGPATTTPPTPPACCFPITFTNPPFSGVKIHDDFILVMPTDIEGNSQRNLANAWIDPDFQFARFTVPGDVIPVIAKLFVLEVDIKDASPTGKPDTTRTVYVGFECDGMHLPLNEPHDIAVKPAQHDHAFQTKHIKKGKEYPLLIITTR